MEWLRKIRFSVIKQDFFSLRASCVQNWKATICEKYYILNNCIIVPNNITQKYKIAFTLNQIRVNSIWHGFMSESCEEL